MANGKSEVEVGFTGTSSPIAKGRSDGRNWEERSSFMHIEFTIGPERPPAAWVVLREVRDGEGGVGYMRQDLHAEVVVDQELGRNRERQRMEFRNSNNISRTRQRNLAQTYFHSPSQTQT